MVDGVGSPEGEGTGVPGGEGVGDGSWWRWTTITVPKPSTTTPSALGSVPKEMARSWGGAPLTWLVIGGDAAMLATTPLSATM